MHDQPLGELMSYQPLSIPFGAGVDTKTDSKMLPSPKLVLLQDCIFTNARRLTKRNGYTSSTTAIVGGGTWSSPTMSQAYNGELTLAATSSLGTGQRLFSYSQELDAWEDKGKYISIGVSKQLVTLAGTTTPAVTDGVTLGMVNSSSVIANNITLSAFDKNYAVTGSTYITVIDQETGVHLCDQLQITNAIGYSKAAILGTSTFAVFYKSNSASNRLAFRIITVTKAGGVVVGSEIPVGAGVTGDSTFTFCYDVVTTSTGCVASLANEGSNKINTFPITTAGSVGASVDITTTGHVLPISLNQDTTGNIWLYWIQNNNAVKYAVYTSVLGVVLAATSVVTLPGAQLAGLQTSTTTQTLYISTRVAPSGWIGKYYPVITQISVATSGTVGSSSVFLNGVELYSKPLVVNSRTYLACVTLSAFQSTGFLLDIGDATNTVPYGVAKFLPDKCDGLFSNTASTSNTVAPLSMRYPGFINSFFTLSSTKYGISTGFVETLGTIALTFGATALYNSATTTQVSMGASLSLFDFNHIDAFQSFTHQDTLVLNGGIVKQYDSVGCSELGFSTDPDGTTGSVDTGTGSLGAGTYSYFVIYQQVDGKGNLQQSAPSLALIAVLTGSTNAVTISINPLTLTEKNYVKVQLYRTINGGTLAYLIASMDNPGPQDPSNESVTFVDSGSATGDGTIIHFPELYTQGGAILENIAPPPALVMWPNNNRAWAVDSENPETTIEYSKTASQGSGISFSTGQLELVMDSKGGAITFGSGMDEKTVILKERAPAYYFVGDGANDAGTGSTLSTPQYVPSDTGCSNSKSGILFPEGILFRSSNNKGIYIFTRGVQVEYFGLDVNAYNSQDIQSAVLVPRRNQIRFLTSSGSSLLYDYVFKQWSAFTNHLGLSATYFEGQYVYVRTDGSLYIEDLTGQYLDNTTSFAPLLQLYWIKAETDQGFSRVRRAMMLGDLQTANGTHGIQISAAYDFSGTFSAPVPYIFTPTDAANGFYQYRERLKRQKADAIQLLIQEIVTPGVAGEYIDFSDLGIEIKPKTGLNKLPGSASVG